MSVYAAADWHGCYWAWEKVKSFLQPNDKLYFLGDAIDRGPDGWQIIKELLNNPQIIYLKGNHEDLMIKALHGNNLSIQTFTNEIQTWYWNGGEVTHNNLIKDNDINKIIYLKKIQQLPFCCIYHSPVGHSILLSHAGCGSFEEGSMWDEEHFLWDRTHYMFYNSYDGNDNEFIVHGHTPIELMIDEQIKWSKKYHDELPAIYSGQGAYFYGQGHKINIDTGTVWNHNTVLLNLDTFEEIIFKKEEINNG